MSLGATTSAPASAWLNAVRASKGKRQIIAHFAPRFLPHDPAMAVAHVFAQAHIGHHQQLRQFLLQQPHRLLHNAVAGKSARRLFILRLGNPEQQNRRHPQRVRLLRFPRRLIRRKLKHPRHRGHGLPRLAPAPRKQRQHQPLRFQRRLPRHPPQRRRAAQPPRTVIRKMAGQSKTHVPDHNQDPPLPQSPIRNASVMGGRARTPCAPRRAGDCPPYLFPLRHRRMTGRIQGSFI